MNEILNLSLKGLKKTHVMYKANLSHNQLEKFLKILTEKKLLTKENNRYITTEKGREFITNFRELLIFLEIREFSYN
jgi:predicted transcriptional regulator